MRQIFEYHPKIGFRFIPLLRARIPHEGGGYLVRTNDTGFRSDHDFVRQRRANTRRILLMGDSFTAGDGVSNGHRYGDHLEKFVPNLEVYNYGLPATGLDQHYLVYQQYARDLEHDLLVIAVFVENVRRVGSRYRYFLNDKGERALYGKPYYTLCDGRLALRGVPPPKLPVKADELSEEDRRHIFATERFPRIKRLFNRLKRHRAFDALVMQTGLKDLALTMIGYQPIGEYDDPGSPAWLVMQAIINEWIGAHPRPVVLMPIPLHHHVYAISSARSYQGRLRAATESAGGTFLDPLAELRQYPPRERKKFYFPNDGHLTKAGHEALAKAIAPAISALLPKTRTA